MWDSRFPPEIDDLQPMLDLRFPDEPPSPIRLHDDPDAGFVEAGEAVNPGTDDGADGTDVPPSAEPQQAAYSPGGEKPDEPPAPAADAPPEVSAIFSALDAVERQAERIDRRSDCAEASDPDPAGPLRLPGSDGASDGPAPAPSHAAGAFLEPPADAPDIERSQTEHDATRSTARQLAAEANATTEALENLKRLLAHRLPDLTMEAAPPSPPLDTVQPPHLQVPAVAQSEAEALRPPDLAVRRLPPPPTAAVEIRGRKAGIELRGFLAGFALSWAFGAVLYAYLVFG